MPITHAIWRVGETPAPLMAARLASEQALEEMIVRDPRILSGEWMLIGRQETTSHGGRIDLLAIAPDGSLVLVALKRDRTPTPGCPWRIGPVQSKALMGQDDSGGPW